MEKHEVIGSMRTLHDLSKAINSTLNVEGVVETVLEKTSVLMGADRVLLLLLDRTENVLSLRSSRGFDGDELTLERFDNVRSFEHCIVQKGTVISMKEVLSEEDYMKSTSVMPQLKDMVFAPLEIKGAAYGLLGISSRKREVSEVELEMFCAMASQAAVAIENANLYKKLKDAFLHTAEALAEAVNSRDPYTGGHTRRVEEYALRVAGALDLPEPEREDLRLAAILHDIGKIGIDDALLRKGGVLSDGEVLMMRKHPEIGARILGYVEEMRGVIPGVLYHHERFDGSGYPEGLKGEDIPLNARIIALVDAFDALTTDRPYKGSINRSEAAEELARNSGTHFDPVLVGVFKKSIKKIDTA